MADTKITYSDIAKCVRKYESCAYDNIGSINLIEDLRLSKNVHETAHSRLLYKFLLIKSGDKDNLYPFLKEFLKVVDCPWKDEKLDKVTVQPEMEHIDVLITFGEHAIIIENKVNRAKDQYGQIIKYYEKLKKGIVVKGTNFADENIYVLYLTRMASDPDPSESSLPEDFKESLGKRYKKISYEKEIRDWLRNSEEYFVRWIKARKEELNNIDKVKNYYSALVQYLLYVNQMFEVDTEEIDVMVKNINNALGIEKATDSFEEVKRYIEPTRDFLSKLENYFVSVVLEQLRKKNNSVECHAKDRKK